ncbi:hypothetical protein CG709_06580 [Lachnotalea glycerini]|nr:ABC transporter permease [Lachnotalea glycerini]OYP32228.1 hypothetical protein CG709_06580 [Lachnotalea glycerini]RDY30049.1 hypothetical protein CG710_016825 [Lachnotalea glycerini]
MKNMILSELYKNVTLKYLIVVFISMFVVISAYSLLFESAPIEEWKENAQEMKELQQEGILALSKESGEENYDKLIDYFNGIVSTIDYCLKNNIPYNPSNVYYFMSRTTNLFTIVIFLCIYLCSRVYSVESENETWKNLVCCGRNRNTIILGKMIFTIMLTCAVFLSYAFISFLVGLFRFGINGNDYIYVKMVEKSIVESNYIVDFFVSIGLSLYKTIFLIVLMTFIYFIFNNDKIALIVPISTFIFAGKINLLIEKYRWKKLLPFHYLTIDMKEVFIRSNMIYGFIIVLLLFMVIMSIGISLSFKHKEY